MAELGTTSLRSDGRQLGLVCPDCTAFVPMTFELHLVADTPIRDGHVEARLKIVNMDEVTDVWRRHVLDDLAAHPSFATPDAGTSIG